MSDDVRRRLEQAGRRPAPGPDPAFADALEARLLAVAASAPPPEPPRRSGPARLRRALAGALVAGVAVAAVLLAVAIGLDRPVATPELTAPVNVEVALRDGTILEDPDGLRLPEGAVVRVGAGGSARIGDTVLAPGDVATVEAGRLRVEHNQPVGVVPGVTPSASPRPVATRSPRPTPAPSRTPGPAAATPSPAPTPVASRPRPTPAPTPTPASTRPPSTPAPTRTDPPPTATPTPAIARPRLRARFVAPSIVRVTWTATPGASSYVLVATAAEASPAPRPVYPGGRIIGEFSSAPEAPLRYRVPAAVAEVRLLVVALASDGTELARSRVITVATGG
jgi:hypothetical protein